MFAVPTRRRGFKIEPVYLSLGGPRCHTPDCQCRPEWIPALETRQIQGWCALHKLECLLSLGQDGRCPRRGGGVVGTALEAGEGNPFPNGKKRRCSFGLKSSSTCLSIRFAPETREHDLHQSYVLTSLSSSSCFCFDRMDAIVADDTSYVDRWPLPGASI